MHKITHAKHADLPSHPSWLANSDQSVYVAFFTMLLVCFPCFFFLRMTNYYLSLSFTHFMFQYSFNSSVIYFNIILLVLSYKRCYLHILKYYTRSPFLYLLTDFKNMEVLHSSLLFHCSYMFVDYTRTAESISINVLLFLKHVLAMVP